MKKENKDHLYNDVWNNNRTARIRFLKSEEKSKEILEWANTMNNLGIMDEKLIELYKKRTKHVTD